MGYILQKLLDIFAKTMGDIWKKYGIYLAKTLGYIGLRLKVILWHTFGKNYGIYWTKIMGYIMGYIG